MKCHANTGEETVKLKNVRLVPDKVHNMELNCRQAGLADFKTYGLLLAMLLPL